MRINKCVFFQREGGQQVHLSSGLPQVIHELARWGTFERLVPTSTFVLRCAAGRECDLPPVGTADVLLGGLGNGPGRGYYIAYEGLRDTSACERIAAGVRIRNLSAEYELAMGRPVNSASAGEVVRFFPSASGADLDNEISLTGGLRVDLPASKAGDADAVRRACWGSLVAARRAYRVV